MIGDTSSAPRFHWQIDDSGDYVTVYTVVTRQIGLLSMKRSGIGWMIAVGPNGNWSRTYDVETLRTIAETILKTIDNDTDSDN